tara:strand:- start:304 stop:420 length:117 start_codon:yes stop_codon:yes gene_type:complete
MKKMMTFIINAFDLTFSKLLPKLTQILGIKKGAEAPFF